MLKDITIGQHFPGKSPVHNLDARLKIVLTVAFVVVMFLSTNFPGLILCAAFVLTMYKISGIPLKMLKKSIKPLLPLIVFTVILSTLSDSIHKHHGISANKKGLSFQRSLTLSIL